MLPPGVKRQRAPASGSDSEEEPCRLSKKSHTPEGIPVSSDFLPAGESPSQVNPEMVSSRPHSPPPVTAPSAPDCTTPVPQQLPVPPTPSMPVTAPVPPVDPALPSTSKPPVDPPRPSQLDPIKMRFKVPTNTGFNNPYEVVMAIELENKEAKFTVRPNLQKELVITPQTLETSTFLRRITVLNGKPVSLIPLHPEEKPIRAILMGYPPEFPVERIQKHPKVFGATRRLSANKQETNQVIVELQGQIPEKLRLGAWGSYKLRPFVPQPLRCYKCQQYGHHQSRCRRKAACAICSGAHESEECFQKHKQGVEVPHRCPNCHQQHPVWSSNCPVRLQHMKKPSGTPSSPAQPTATGSAWVSPPTPAPAPPAPLLTADNFPPLAPSRASARALSAPQPSSPRTAATAPQAPSLLRSDCYVIPKENMRELIITMASAIGKCLGVQHAGVAEVVTAVMDQVLEKVQPPLPSVGSLPQKFVASPVSETSFPPGPPQGKSPPPPATPLPQPSTSKGVTLPTSPARQSQPPPPTRATPAPSGAALRPTPARKPTSVSMVTPSPPTSRAQLKVPQASVPASPPTQRSTVETVGPLAPDSPPPSPGDSEASSSSSEQLQLDESTTDDNGSSSGEEDMMLG